MYAHCRRPQTPALADRLGLPACTSQSRLRMSEWKELIDPRTGRIFYGNEKTKETTWHMPEEMKR